MTADVFEENNQRISRIVKAIKEAQANEDPATVSINETSWFSQSRTSS